MRRRNQRACSMKPANTALPAAAYCSAVLHRAARDAAAENAGGAHRGQPGQRGAAAAGPAGGVWRVGGLIRLLTMLFITPPHTYTHHPPTQMNYQYKHLVGAMIVAGWDEDDGGQVRAPAAAAAAAAAFPQLLAWQRTPWGASSHQGDIPPTSVFAAAAPVQVYGCPIGGTISREAWTTDGSGSTFLWGFLDSEFRCVEEEERGGRGGGVVLLLLLPTCCCSQHCCGCERAASDTCLADCTT